MDSRIEIISLYISSGSSSLIAFCNPRRRGLDAAGVGSVGGLAAGISNSSVPGVA